MIFSRVPHRWVFIDVLVDAWVEEVMKVSVKLIVINVWAGVVVNALSGVWVDATIDVGSDIGVEVLTARAVVVHSVLDIDPNDPVKMSCLLARE